MRSIRATIAVLLGALALALASGGAATAAAAALSIKVEGNRFVDGEGRTVRLLGVNHPSFEYACEQGWGYDDGHMDAADAAAVASWNANAVRVPLNEDCWLGINGQPDTSAGEPLTAAGYRGAVESYVADLNAHGIYAILDLHWSGPGGKVANGQQPMPDEHSTAFWSSVAATFKADPAVVFDLFNEPFSPGDPRSGDDPAHPVGWGCWANGGCPVPYYDEGDRTGTIYSAVGMGTLLDAVRATGATQPVLLGGLDYANDLGGWLANVPADPLGQEAASFHNYQGKSCDSAACWNGTIASIAGAVPVVTGEFDEDVCAPTGFDDGYMNWADAHGVGYLAWGWWVLSPGEISAAGCSAYYLLTDWNGTAASPNGTNLRSHLLSLPPGGRTGAPASGDGGAGSGGGAGAGGKASGGGAGPAGGKAGGGRPGGGKPGATAIRLTRFVPTVKAGDASVTFRIAATRSCAGTISGRTVKRFRSGGGRPHLVALGGTRVRLEAGKTATVKLSLSARARRLLKAKDALPSRFTVTLSAGAGAPTVLHRTATLRAPRPKQHRGR